MKTILTLAILIPFISFGQFPINEDFNSGAPGWAFTNGAGIQNYGGSSNYGTFNIGNTPYPNNSYVTILSPIQSMSSCAVNVDVEFALNGIIENGWDFMRFYYYDGAINSWVFVNSYTGSQNIVENYSIPNTAIRFAFQLSADGSVNTYWNGGGYSVYYYDIDYFNIICSSGLPVELTSFDAECGLLTWTTTSEKDNDYFLIEQTRDGINWSTTAVVNGAGTTTQESSYSLNIQSKGLMYYRLTQFDFNGDSEQFKTISLDCSDEDREVVGVYNVIGQLVESNIESVSVSGVYIIVYSNGETDKIYLNR